MLRPGDEWTISYPPPRSTRRRLLASISNGCAAGRAAVTRRSPSGVVALSPEAITQRLDGVARPFAVPFSPRCPLRFRIVLEPRQLGHDADDTWNLAQERRQLLRSAT